jgi:predicted small lipoprotein YifL
MIKKISLILIVFGMLFSCGKKGDPVYVDPDKKVHKSSTFNVKIL